MNRNSSFLQPQQSQYLQVPKQNHQKQQQHIQHSYKQTVQKENHEHMNPTYIPNFLITKETKEKKEKEKKGENGFDKTKFMNIFKPKLEKCFDNLTNIALKELKTISYEKH